MKALINWFDDRTGFLDFAKDALYERVPGGARWRYVWGSTLVFAFVTQMVTGIFLWMVYSPSAQTAWESVFYVQYVMTGGWLLRGVHHFMAHAMIVLLALHLLQVVIDGAYRAPREVNFWLGLGLMGIVLALSLTGYLLPWDQKGYWATKVSTNIMALTPLVGEDLRQLVVGGASYGHHTLTRFFALHAGVLPGLLIFLLVLHVYLFRRHGLHAYKPQGKPDATFWPDQILKDAVACLAVLAVVLVLCTWRSFAGDHTGVPTGEYLGAELGAPADPSSQYQAARPEWYFLFLFQFLKLFPGEYEVHGALGAPMLVVLVMFLMPIVGRWKVGHGFNVGVILCLLTGAAVLTGNALYDDRSGKTDESRQFLASVVDAEVEARRVKELALSERMIPEGGAAAIIRADTMIQGRRLFAKQCVSCHRHTDRSGSGLKVHDPPEAPNLYGFASREWLTGLLNADEIKSDRYFGKTEHADGEMVDFVENTLVDVSAEEVVSIVAALSAQAALPSQADLDGDDQQMIAAGGALIEEHCTDCHKFRAAGELGLAPDLTGYGSREWLMAMIGNPEHERFYRETNDRMPVFVQDPSDPQKNKLSPRELEFVVDWLRGDWYRPADHSAPATAPPTGNDGER